jgi:hypothetical protein
MTFGKDFTQAVEQKQIAQQGAYSLTTRSENRFSIARLTLTPLTCLGPGRNHAQRLNGPSSSSSG